MSSTADDATRGRAPLSVAFLIDRWQAERGGAERALVDFARRLEERGCEVHAIGARGPTPGTPTAGRFHAVRARGLSRATRERDLADAMLARAEELGVDCTVGVRHLPRVDVLWAHGGTHAETLRALGKPGRGRHRAFLDLERRAAEGGARRIVCVADGVREEFERWYPSSASRLVVVPNGVDLARFTPDARGAARADLSRATGWPDDAPLVTFVGDPADAKGLGLLQDALALLRDRPWRLLAAGPRDAGRWTRRARRIGLGEDRFRCVERLDGLALAAGADLLALPSRRDPCPLVVLEALAAGTPVALSDRVGNRDAIANEDAGVVVPTVTDAAAWATALADRLDRVASRTRPGPDRERVRDGVRDRSVEKWWKRLEQVVRETAESVRTHPQRP